MEREATGAIGAAADVGEVITVQGRDIIVPDITRLRSEAAV